MVAPISCSHWSQMKTNPTAFADEMPFNSSLMKAYDAPNCITLWFALHVSIPKFSSSNKLHLKKAFEAFWITFAWWPNVQKVSIGIFFFKVSRHQLVDLASPVTIK